jgi:hypothetical protein
MTEPKYPIAAYTAEHGGGTFDALTREPFAPRHGYAVAVAHGTAAIVRRADHVDAAAIRVAQEFGAPFVGTWLDPYGDVHVDPVEYVIDRQRAIRYGRERAQAAIFEFSTGEEIAL